MRLYKLTTRFEGKDMYAFAGLGYVIAASDAEVADHINRTICFEEWFGYAEGGNDIVAVRADYIANKGDFHTPYVGEFYDQKYSWEDLGEVTGDQIAVLTALNVATLVSS